MKGQRILSGTLALVLLLALAVGLTQAQEPVGTAFTYQGRLDDGGSPADGTYDFEFKLYDADSDGSQMGSTVIKDDITVTDGIFTVELDFGSNIFTGDARWLEISVRLADSTDDYTTLIPRQQLRSAPYALALPGLWTQPNDTSPNVIGGYSGNIVTDGVVGATISGGGRETSASDPGTNMVTDDYGTVGGGRNNEAGNYATVGGGFWNDATGDYAIIGGGANNDASGEATTIGGGANNDADGEAATVGGGLENTATFTYTTVSGGFSNEASGEYATVSGGEGNIASDSHATVSGGLGNEASGIRATIGGGTSNIVTATHATVSGGVGNEALDFAATIGGGMHNDAFGTWATIGGGSSNDATAAYSTVGGGFSNEALSFGATVGGGFGNNAGLLGGDQDATISPLATVGGGSFNEAKADYATIPGGSENTAAGDYSFAAGRRAKALHDGAFVWADSTTGDYKSTDPNQFRVRANGGVFFNDDVIWDPTNGLNDTLTGLSCSSGQVAKWNGTTWVCGNDETGNGDGDITAVYAGDGLTGGGESGDVTLSADTGYLQQRVSGSCAEGNAIRVVHEDGAVTCEPVTVPAHDHWGETWWAHDGVYTGLELKHASSATEELQIKPTLAVVNDQKNEYPVALFETHGQGNLTWGVVRIQGNDPLTNYDLIQGYNNPVGVVFKVDINGAVYAHSYNTLASDFAEMLPAVEGLEPADVLVISPDGKLARSTQAYQPAVVGVYSTQPGFLGGADEDADLTGKVPLAVVGVVPVKASAENGPIQPGDILTASSTPGHAMKADPNPPVGTVLGKALEGLDEGTGVIQILVTLQ